MQWLIDQFTDFPEEKSPLVTLLLYRYSPPSQITNEQLNGIPYLDKSQILKINSILNEGGDIKSAFSHVSHLFQWNNEKAMEKYVEHQISQQKHQFSIVEIFFMILSFLLQNLTERKETDFVFLVDLLNCTISSEFSSITSFFFHEVVIIFLDDNEFDWNPSVVKSFSYHFILNPHIDQRLSLLVIRVLRLCIKNGIVDAYDHILNSIIYLITQKPEFFQTEDYTQIIAIMDPLIQILDLRSIKIISMISAVSPFKMMRDCFFIIPSVLVNVITEMPQSVLIDIDIKSEQQQLSIPKDFLFSDGDPLVFEKGFVPPKCTSFESIEAVSTILSETLFNLIKRLVEVLGKAHTQCIDCFFMSLQKSILVYENSPIFFDLFSVFLFFADNMKSNVSILPFMKLLSSPRIFCPEMTIFDNSIDKKLDFLRNHVFLLLSHGAPSLMGEFLIDSQSHPLLFVEHACRFLYSSNSSQRVFTTYPSLQAIGNVIKQLRYLYSTTQNHCITLALHAIFSFVFYLFSDAEAESECFYCRDFLFEFLSYVFDSSLRSKILMYFRDYLIRKQSQIGLDTISAIIIELLTENQIHLDDKRSHIAFFDICDVLLDIMIHNPMITPYFVSLLNNILSFSMRCSSSNTLLNSLKFVSILSKNLDYFELDAKQTFELVQVIYHTEGITPSQSTYITLLNICASSSSILPSSLFLIRVPSIIPVFIASFGQSQLITSILLQFLNLCKFSKANCHACHRGGLDSLLIGVLKANTIEGPRIIKYRGFEFVLSISDEEIESVVIPLLSIICQEKSSSGIAFRFIGLVLNETDTNISSRNCRVLNSILSYARMKPCFVLGTNEPFIINHDFSPNVINRVFTFCFWIKVDQPLALLYQDSIRIFTLGNTVESQLSVFISRGSLYFSYKNSSCLCINEIPSNQWMFYSLSVQRSSNDVSSLSFFHDNEIDFCQDIPALYFDDEKLIAEFGGYGKNTNDNAFAFLGHFGFSGKLLTESSLSSLSLRGSSQLVEDSSFFFTSEDCIDSDQWIDNCSILYHLSLPGHITRLMLKFNQDHNDSKDLYEMIVSIMKQVFKNSMNSQIGFRGFITLSNMMINNQKLIKSYTLYLAFYSLLESMSDKLSLLSLFDNIVTSPHIWSHGQVSVFSRVVNHWANTLVKQYRDSMKRPGLFYKHLLFYNSFFPTIDQNPDNTKMSLVYITFLDSIGKCYLEKNDVLMLFGFIQNAQIDFILSHLIKLLVFISRVAIQLDESFVSFCLPLLGLCRKHSTSIIVNSIYAIHELSRPLCLIPLTAVGQIVSTCESLNLVFNELISSLSKYPGLFHAISILSLRMEEENKDKASISIKTLSDSIDAYEWITFEPLWFMWPVVLSSVSNNSSISHLFSFIGKFASKVPGMGCLDSVLDLIQILESRCGNGIIHCSHVIFKKYLSGPNAVIDNEEIQERVFRLLFYRNTDFFHNSQLLELFQKSDFPFEKSSKKHPQCFEDVVFLLRDPPIEKLVFGLELPESDTSMSFLLLDLASKLNGIRHPTLNSITENILSKSKFESLKNGVYHQIEIDTMFFNSKCIPRIKEIHESLIKFLGSVSSYLNKATYIKTYQEKHYENSEIFHIKQSFEVQSVYSSIYNQNDLYSHLDTCPCYGFIPAKNKLYYKTIESDSLHIEQELFSETVTQWVFGQPKSVFLVITSEAIIVDNIRHNIDSIEFALVRPYSCIEFFSATVSILIEYSSLHRIIAETKHLLLSPAEIFSKVRFSKFEAFVLLTLFSGKSFHHPQLIPMYGSIPLITCAISSKENITNTIIVRKKVFDLDLPSIFPGYCTPQHLEPFSYKEVKYQGLGFDAEPIYIAYIAPIIIIISNNGEIRRFSVPNKENQSITFLSSSKLDSLPSKTQITHNENCIMILFPPSSIICITHDDQFEKIALAEPVYLSQDVFCDESTIYFNTESIALSSHRITTISSSSKWDCVAYGTEDCYVYIHSLSGPFFTSSINLKGIEPSRIMITHCLGIVIIQAQNTLYFYTINGEHIGSHLIKSEIISWCQISNKESIDYLIITDRTNTISSISPFSPDNINQLYHSEVVIKHISAIDNTDTIMGVSETGVIFFIPLK